MEEQESTEHLWRGPAGPQGFQWLIDKLLAPAPEIEACECLVADTVFLGEDGQMLCWARTEKGKVVKQEAKVGFQDSVRQRFPSVATARKRETRHILQTLKEQFAPTEGRESAGGSPGPMRGA